MEYDFREILDVGLEIEFSNIKRETPIFVNTLQRNLSNFRHVHDASTETPEITIGNIPLQFEINGKTNKLLSILRNKSMEVFGGEINSPILSSNNFKQSIYKLMDFLIDMGESHSTTEQDNRGSIHVHVNVSKDIKHKHLIRLLELGLATEAIFYRLGGMGRVNRGVKNSFAYQRPLTLPPCVNVRGKHYPIFDYKDLLTSKDKTDFYNKYGDSVYQIRNNNHYVTQRYMGLNFYSIPYRGSLEFRYANKVLIPEWIVAWIILCQSFVNYALTKPKDISFESEFRKLEDNRDIPIDELDYIFSKLDISEEYKITLFDIWRQSDLPIFNGKHLVTHLQNPTFYSGFTSYIPEPVTKAEKIIVEDVRTINSSKAHQLININNENMEVDYIIDISGVKQKVRDLGIQNNPNNNIRDSYIRHWAFWGFNIQNYTHEDARGYIQSRILRDKTLPLVILRKGVEYEFSTKYEYLNITLKLKERENSVCIRFYNEELDSLSGIYEMGTHMIEDLVSRAINLVDIIDECHNNPDTFFNNGGELEEFEDDLEEEFDDNFIEDNEDNGGG